MYKLSQIPEEYKKKLITAEQAAALVKDGDRVSYGLGCAAPYDIDIEIGKRAKDLHGVEIVATTVVKDEPYAAYLNRIYMQKADKDADSSPTPPDDPPPSGSCT